MKILSWISCGLLAASTAIAYEVPTELIIETTFAPPDCSQSQKASKGMTVQVHYTGTLHKTGAKFDSSHDRGTPLGFKLGSHQVISGWDQGIEGMCVKEKRTLTIPPHLAYGTKGFGAVIPPNSALVFDVELVSMSDAHDEL